jgi:hypothetical protein
MTTGNAGFSLPLLLEERSGTARLKEPVTVGIPLPRGLVFEPAALALVDQKHDARPLQVQVLARWFDGSMKWALLDFQASVEAHERAIYTLQHMLEPVAEAQSQGLTMQRLAEAVVVDTGQGRFFLSTQVCKPFDRVVVQGTDVLEAGGSRLVLTDATGQEYEAHIHSLAVETAGPLRITLKIQGEFRIASYAILARFVARLSFYAGSSLVELQMMLHNPRAARHPGGLWDLGDKGSIYFKDLSLHLPLRTSQDLRVTWTAQPSQPMQAQTCAHLEVYQDSSGGENWRSINHVNRFGQVMHAFKGYRVLADGGVLQAGERAMPVLTIQDGETGIAATIDKFWQNFPKALEVHHHQLILRLFPQQYSDVYELQGGEQKTHTTYVQFTGPGTQPADLGWVHDRLIPRTTPEWYASSKAFSYLTPSSQDRHAECQALVETAITGPQSFFARREIIDEYGWRHFGDLYADHEAVGHTGETPLVAHYNNQYDVIYGAIIHYVRSGDWRWFVLMHDLARHVIDIDIYHTQEDRSAYNGGLFWHTDHSTTAATATHRAYSKATLEVKPYQRYGGGPSNEHNYTTGLLHYYFLTGDMAAREAVRGLANWVINMDHGGQHWPGRFDSRPTGLCSATAGRDYHGPGRGSGNSLNVLLDAYLLTRQESYLIKAEQLIRRCIHPNDPIQERHLDDVEHRWSYTVFLQALGKYLGLKADKGDVNYMYSYARASLLHYARWMLVHEVPYTHVLDRVKIPSETWPAQDIRKSIVFHLAAKYASDPLRSACRQKAEYFFQACIHDLRTFPTCTLARPVVLLMTNAYMHTYFQIHPEETAPLPYQQYDFGQPQPFTPQFSELYRVREKLIACVQSVKTLHHCLGSVLQRAQSRLEGYRG